MLSHPWAPWNLRSYLLLVLFTNPSAPGCLRTVAVSTVPGMVAEPNVIRPPSLIYVLPSILERVDLSKLFSTDQPLEVELGSGDGSFLVEYARQNPTHNLIGVERLLGRIRKMERKARRAGLTNLRGVRIESSYFLEQLLPLHSASALHIYFPDPWPKRKHRRHRLVNERFPGLALGALRPGGRVYLRTDDADYFEQMLAVFAARKDFQPVQAPAALTSVLTDFERDFLERGIATLSAAYQRE
jgi:tRNA (guanine-N7-)-methyltransferase